MATHHLTHLTHLTHVQAHTGSHSFVAVATLCGRMEAVEHTVHTGDLPAPRYLPHRAPDALCAQCWAVLHQGKP